MAGTKVKTTRVRKERSTQSRFPKGERQLKEELLRLWDAYAAKGSAVPDPDEADRIALEAVAEVRRGV